MGGTGSVTSGRLSAFGNPAGLAGLEGARLTAGHNAWLGDAGVSYLSWSFPAGGLSAAVSGSFTHVGGLERREGPTSDPIDTFSAWGMSLKGSCALSTGIFDLGASAGLAREKVWLESSLGPVFDAGARVRPLEGLALALSFQHIGPSVRMADDDFRLPTTWRMGASWTTGTPAGELEVAAEVRKPLDNRPEGGAGLELSPVDWLSVRGGYRFLDDTRGLTAGLGLGAAGWSLDYAYVPTSYALGDVHRFTLGRAL